MKKIFSLLSNITLMLVIILLLFVLVVPLVFSGRVAVVLSGSMAPAMPTGALAVTVPVDIDEIKVGDIITFSPYWDPEVTVSHRVINIIERKDGSIAFKTKGDASDSPDPWVVPATEACGKVIFNIPQLGYFSHSVMNYAQSLWGFALLVALPSMLLIGSAVRDAGNLSNRRQRRMQTWLKRRQRARFR